MNISITGFLFGYEDELACITDFSPIQQETDTDDEDQENTNWGDDDWDDDDWGDGDMNEECVLGNILTLFKFVCKRKIFAKFETYMSRSN